MSNVLTQAFVYLLLLGVGYGFKRAGIFRVEDSAFLKSVILYITMPATAAISTVQVTKPVRKHHRKDGCSSRSLRPLTAVAGLVM